MIELREIRTADPSFGWAEQLWLSSFPICERRDIDEQRHNTDTRTNFHYLLAEDNGKPIGFITYWHFSNFCYGEHLATDPTCRNNGYGTQILTALRLHLNSLSPSLPFVLEVEMPTDELSQRRIAFYERNGFTLWSHCPYVQPPYRPTDEPLPMLLMVQGNLQPKTDFQRIQNVIHREVYGVAE